MLIALMNVNLLPTAAARDLDQGECIRQIRTLYTRQDSMVKNLSDETTLYLNYTISTTTLNFQMQPITTQNRMEIYTNKTRSYSISSESEIYRDEKVIVFISPKRKTIMINHAGKAPRTEALMQHTALVQDTLFSLAQEESCGYEKTAAGDRVKRIKLKMSEQGLKLFKIKTMDISLDQHERFVRKITVDYDDNYRFKQVTLTFDTFSFNYKTDKLQRSALSMVFDSDNILHARYNDYKVIDRRTGRKTRKSNP